MQPAGDFLFRRGIDPPLTLDPAKPFERRRNDANTKMRLSAFARTGMTGMCSAFIPDDELIGCERRFEFAAQSFGNGRRNAHERSSRGKRCCSVKPFVFLSFTTGTP